MNKPIRFTFELAWKTMKDYLEEEGFLVNSPKSAIRQAFQSGYLLYEEQWMEALKKRNDSVHTYTESAMNETVEFIQQIFANSLNHWYQVLKADL